MIFVPILEVAGGLGLLLIGGEFLLRGAVALARRFGLSHLLIGMTVVSAATSMPELVVTVTTGLEGVPDIGIGNVIGSNIANVLLILGAAALVFPIRTKPREMLRDTCAMLVATGLFIGVAYFGVFTWLHGIAMIALLALYVAYTYTQERRRSNNAETASAEDDGEIHAPRSCGIALLLVAVGVVGLGVGSELLIHGALQIARAAMVSEAVIGLTLVAVGTSLPELATSIVASMRRHSEVALGNVVGSNLFNLLAVLGALALATPFQVPHQLLGLDVWVMAGSSLLLVPIMLTSWRIGRVEGSFFLLLYALYIGWQFHRMPVVG